MEEERNIPRREQYRANNGGVYTLWGDINDLLSAAVPPPAGIREQVPAFNKGAMFRGQRNAEWGMVPTLYRPPVEDAVIKAREGYTGAFVNSLRQRSDILPNKLTDLEYLGIAQHYGFHTPLLDFTWNIEVAAYFATLGGQPGDIGVIYTLHARDYEILSNWSNPGLVFEPPQRQVDQIEPNGFPDRLAFDVDVAPRISAQQGMFFHVRAEQLATFNHQCDDRHYFRQRRGLVHLGNFPSKQGALMGRRHFLDRKSYQAYFEQARKELPELFDRSISFGDDDVFPTVDQLSTFALEWKNANPSPHAGLGEKKPASTVAEPIAAKFSEQCERYYYGTHIEEPDRRPFLADGRTLVESLCRFRALDDELAQRWLLWELFNRHVGGGGMKALLKFGSERWRASRDLPSDWQGVTFFIADLWPGGGGHEFELSWRQLELSAWRIQFGKLDDRWRSMVAIEQTSQLESPKNRALLDVVRRPVKGLARLFAGSNPHKYVGGAHMLRAIEHELASQKREVITSFLDDFYRIVALEVGRRLELRVGIVEGISCMQRSRRVRQTHEPERLLHIQLLDRMFGGITHTAVCQRHWDFTAAREFSLVRPPKWLVLGLD